jgi:hypothetical protein
MNTIPISDNLLVNDGNDNYVFAKDVMSADERKEALLRILAKQVVMEFTDAANEADVAVECAEIRFKYHGKVFALHKNERQANDV